MENIAEGADRAESPTALEQRVALLEAALRSLTPQNQSGWFCADCGHGYMWHESVCTHRYCACPKFVEAVHE